MIEPGSGFPLKLEDLDPTLRMTTYSAMEYLGEGPRPKYRPRWEWLRVHVLRRPRRWKILGWDDILRRAV